MIAVKCEDSIFWSPMQASSFTLTLATVQDGPIATPIGIELLPVSGSAGGQHMRTPEFKLNGATTCRVSGIASLDVGTNYQITVDAENYQLTSFFKRLIPGEQEADPLTLLVNPASVKGININSFDQLNHPHLPEVLNNSSIALSGNTPALQGAALYNGLSTMQQACLLNIASKANHETADSIWERVQSLIRIEQDRCFCAVDQNIKALLDASPQFNEAGKLLHKPISGFTLVKSFKTVDLRANLQITLMNNPAGEWVADLDIDEATGFKHGFEVFRNMITGGLTNPYQVHELMLVGDPDDADGDSVVDPGYNLLFS